MNIGVYSGIIVVALVLISQVWVLIDASRLSLALEEINDSDKTISPWGWFIACVCLWIIFFPIYVIFKRVNILSYLKAIEPSISIRSLGYLKVVLKSLSAVCFIVVFFVGLLLVRFL